MIIQGGSGAAQPVRSHSRSSAQQRRHARPVSLLLGADAAAGPSRPCATRRAAKRSSESTTPTSSSSSSKEREERRSGLRYAGLYLTLRLRHHPSPVQNATTPSASRRVHSGCRMTARVRAARPHYRRVIEDHRAVSFWQDGAARVPAPPGILRLYDQRLAHHP